MMLAESQTWTPPHLAELPAWPAHGRVGLDIECYDPDMNKTGPGVRRDGYIVGVSFAIEDGPSFYLPLRHKEGPNYVEPEMALLYLRDQAAAFKGFIVGANLQYDLDYLEEAGVVFPHARYRDIQIAGPLLETEVLPDGRLPNMNLEALLARNGMPGKREDGLRRFAEEHGLHPKKDIWRMPAGVVAPYAIGDVELPLKLMRKQERDLDRWRDEDIDAGVQPGRTIWDLHELESDLLPVLVSMRRRGVRVDLSKLEQIEEMALREQTEAMRTVSTLTGVNLDPLADAMRPSALAPALRAVGLDVPKTAKKGKDSITSGWLESQNHDVTKALLVARKYSKVRTTYIASIHNHGIHRNGETRIHGTFNQLRSTNENNEEKGAAFGRLSGSDPNVQNQPMRDEVIGPLWRSLYVPDEGGRWAKCDLSSQEPRWVVHFAELVGAPGAAFAAAEYRDNPRIDIHAMTAKLTGLSRTHSKPLFLGKLYGMGEAKFCHTVGLPTVWERPDWANGRLVERAGPEGKAMLQRFEQRVPFVKALSKKAEESVKRKGFIRTVLGRRCYFRPEAGGNGYFKSYKALNRLIQGSSGDQVKRAMVDLFNAGFEMQLQVHDEIDLTIYTDKTALDVARMMEDAVPANVPFVVDAEVGPHWGELEKLK